jgi:predicted AAA+ superfamily ATPase
LTRRLPPFYINIKKRLVKSPKIFIRDTGVLHSLLGLSAYKQLWNSIHLGASWESFIVEQIITNKDQKMEAWFYRTHEGTECDLLLTRNDIPISCIEMKITQAPRRTKSLTLAIGDLKTNQNFIIVPKCDESYKLSENITVCNISQFIRIHLPLL